jgi:hypothetical protein
VPEDRLMFCAGQRAGAGIFRQANLWAG